MHYLSPVLWGEDAELEFLRVRLLVSWWGECCCLRAHSQPFPLELSLGGQICSDPHGGMIKGFETKERLLEAGGIGNDPPKWVRFSGLSGYR